MIIRVVPEARLELRDAADYYEKQQPGLGRRLWQEADEHILWISLHPDVPRLRPAGYRRVNLRVFPHYVAYISPATMCSGFSPSDIRTDDRNIGSIERRK